MSDLGLILCHYLTPPTQYYLNKHRIFMSPTFIKARPSYFCLKFFILVSRKLYSSLHRSLQTFIFLVSNFHRSLETFMFLSPEHNIPAPNLHKSVQTFIFLSPIYREVFRLSYFCLWNIIFLSPNYLKVSRHSNSCLQFS